MNKILKAILLSFLCTVCVLVGVCILLSIFNGHEMFVTVFSFGIGIIFSLFLSTFLIIENLNKLQYNKKDKH